MIRVLSGLAAAATLAACASPGAERIIREEVDYAEAGTPVCLRMAEDFDMLVAEGDIQTGRLFSANLLGAIVTGAGVGFSLSLTDQDNVERCVNTPSGVSCDIEGPAQLRVSTPGGTATYFIRAGERARVATARSRLLCREAPLAAQL